MIVAAAPGSAFVVVAPAGAGPVVPAGLAAGAGYGTDVGEMKSSLGMSIVSFQPRRATRLGPRGAPVDARTTRTSTGRRFLEPYAVRFGGSASSTVCVDAYPSSTIPSCWYMSMRRWKRCWFWL